MGKILDFLQSRTFLTHVTGLLGILGAGYTVPNCPWVSLAIAVVTGATQASHAYQAVKAQPTVSAQDLQKAVGV